MIKVTQLNNNHLISFDGEKKDFNQYMFLLSKVERKKYSLKDKGWVVPDLTEIENVFGYKGIQQNVVKQNDIQLNVVSQIDDEAYRDIGKNMKLQPYPYQKEAIKFCIDNLKALLVLPCGSGKFNILLCK